MFITLREFFNPEGFLLVLADCFIALPVSKRVLANAFVHLNLDFSQKFLFRYSISHATADYIPSKMFSNRSTLQKGAAHFK